MLFLRETRGREERVPVAEIKLDLTAKSATLKHHRSLRGGSIKKCLFKQERARR
jgi:hypothetical protein